MLHTHTHTRNHVCHANYYNSLRYHNLPLNIFRMCPLRTRTFSCLTKKPLSYLRKRAVISSRVCAVGESARARASEWSARPARAAARAWLRQPPLPAARCVPGGVSPRTECLLLLVPSFVLRSLFQSQFMFPLCFSFSPWFVSILCTFSVTPLSVIWIAIPCHSGSFSPSWRCLDNRYGEGHGELSAGCCQGVSSAVNRCLCGWWIWERTWRSFSLYGELFCVSCLKTCSHTKVKTFSSVIFRKLYHFAFPFGFIVCLELISDMVWNSFVFFRVSIHGAQHRLLKRLSFNQAPHHLCRQAGDRRCQYPPVLSGQVTLP